MALKHGPLVTKAINFTLRILLMLSKENHDRVKDIIYSFDKQEDLIHFLTEPIELYFRPKQEPTKALMRRIIKDEKIIIDERFGFHQLYDDAKNVVKVKARKALCLLGRVRRNQQTTMDGKMAKDNDVRNYLGQVAGDSKKGSLNDTQICTILGHTGPNSDILKELMSVGSNDLEAKKEFNKIIAREGEASLSDIPNASGNKSSLNYMDQMLKVCGYDSNLINPIIRK